MTATTIEAMQNEADTPSFIRKIGIGVGFLAEMSVDLPAALTDAAGLLQTLPVGFNPVGIVNPDGYTFNTEAEDADTEAFGYVTPPRTDITSIARSIVFSPYELHKRHMMELTTGMDLSTVEQSAGGEIVFDEPNLPTYKDYRFIVVGADGPVDNQWILGLGFYRVKLSAADAEQWQKEGALTRAVTLKVQPDDDAGSPVRRYIGGTGAKAAATTLGYTQVTP